ncbi:hypothetical protein K3727_02120 [Rhodobacteraceae bacterium M382]|nr:hypothetical protein K3727_02120 [Rhodobacteraceae bacterium M382]
MQKPEDFQKFYYTKVGMGEACGCAERVIDVYEFNRKGGTIDRVDVPSPRKRRSWKSLARKYGLLSRPKRPE